MPASHRTAPHRADLAIRVPTVVITLILVLAACGGGGDGGSDGGGRLDAAREDAGSVPGGTLITEEGGSISTVDLHGNQIEITFPAGALASAIRVAVRTVPDRPDIEIATRHVPAFEILPYDLELYEPVSVMIRHRGPVGDHERTLLVRERPDGLLIPLADHHYFDGGGDGEVMTRAFAYSTGLFAEGVMSAEQVARHLEALLEHAGITLMKLDPLDDDTCYTHITKALWDDWKEYSDGVAELDRVAQEMALGLYPHEALEQALCDEAVGRGAQMILDRCVPEDVCDRDHRYVTFDVLAELQACGFYGTPLHDAFYERFEAIMTRCIDAATLRIELSARETFDLVMPPYTSVHTEITYAASGSVPLVISAVDSAGRAQVEERDRELSELPLVGGGSAIVGEQTCGVTATGYVRIDVGGTRDASDRFTLQVTGHQYQWETIECPGLPIRQNTMDHVDSKGYEVELAPENHFTAAVTSYEDDRWTMNAQLFLQEEP